jgi:hypothetical protein
MHSTRWKIECGKRAVRHSQIQGIAVTLLFREPATEGGLSAVDDAAPRPYVSDWS